MQREALKLGETFDEERIWGVVFLSWKKSKISSSGVKNCNLQHPGG